jgi:hypothetical protein
VGSFMRDPRALQNAGGQRLSAAATVACPRMELIQIEGRIGPASRCGRMTDDIAS